MHHGFDFLLGERLFHQGAIRQIADDQLARRYRGAMPGNQVVVDPDRVPGALQEPRSMTADISGSADDENIHP